MLTFKSIGAGPSIGAGGARGAGGAKGAGGFTLIEVVAALAIFGLAALAAVFATSNHLSSLAHMQDKTMARYVAANTLAKVTLDYPPRDGDSGNVEFADRPWHWQVQVLETATADLYFVTVEVRAEPEGPVLHTLTSFVGPF